MVEHLTEKTRHNSDAGWIAPCCKVFSPTVRLPRAARYFLPQSDCPVLQVIFSHSQIAPCCKVFSPTVRLPRAARYFLPQSDCPVLQGIFSHSQIAPCCKVFSPTVRLPRAARYFLPQSDCPVLQGIFSHSQLPVQTLLHCSYGPRVQLHASASVHTLQIPNPDSHTVVWIQENAAHTGRNG